MPFLRLGLVAFVLVLLTLLLESAGLAALIYWGKTSFALDVTAINPLHGAYLVAKFTSVIIGLHILQIFAWSLFYRWQCFPSLETAFYFSLTSYSTVGYGDIVLPLEWRPLGPVQSLTGVLMCGLSGSFIFAVVTRLMQR